MQKRGCMRKNFPVADKTHKEVLKHLNDLELMGVGKPTITSWVKIACLEKIAREMAHLKKLGF